MPLRVTKKQENVYLNISHEILELRRTDSGSLPETS